MRMCAPKLHSGLIAYQARRCLAREQVDRRVEDALRGAVRRSLSELARLLVGDKRAEVAPLFTVALAVERTNRIELRPTVQVRRKPLQGCSPAKGPLAKLQPCMCLLHVML